MGALATGINCGSAVTCLLNACKISRGHISPRNLPFPVRTRKTRLLITNALKENASNLEEVKLDSLGESSARCGCCARRHLLACLGCGCCANQSAMATVGASSSSFKSKASWRQELFANVMANGMDEYESKVASLKESIFAQLPSSGASHIEVLELGMGAGPNLKFYGNRPGLHVTAVDPNSAMEPYARQAALAAGLTTSQLDFRQGVGERLEVGDGSVDAVVGTLVMCSVQDVAAALAEVVRVLRPGGMYLFVEHCAAPGSDLPFVWKVHHHTRLSASYITFMYPEKPQKGLLCDGGKGFWTPSNSYWQMDAI